jgi:lipoprotein NlpD
LKAILPVLALVLVAGCTPQRWSAPVEDRRSPPRKAVRAPAPAPAPSAAPAASPAGSYIVKRGDTLYSIALEHGHDYRDVAQWNSLDDPTRLRVGQALRVAPPEDGAVVLGAAPSTGRVESRPLGSPPGQKPAEPKPAEPKPAAQKPAPREEPRLEAQPVQFLWPAKGKLLSGFASGRQKGIDIEGKVGDPVIAAAAGRVTYVGSGIPGLGKLVVIRHEQGFITVYAHNKDIMVKEQQQVTRGQKIAEVGASDAERPKLHFQIRKGSAAVDPLLYLPKS